MVNQDRDVTRARLGRLTKVDLRVAWATEHREFTPWLSSEENLELLGETIGIDLELVAQEYSVGPFSADIVCKDTARDHLVLIENQLEPTNHTHLGQLLTYAAGLHAVTMVWIASRYVDEHRAALDWLNEVTSEGVTFFGLEIEVWRIGDSLLAPKFNIVSKPNNWTKIVASGTRGGTGDRSATKEQYLAYWIAFRESALESAILRPPNAQSFHEMNFGMGKSGIVLRARITTREPWIQAAVVITDPRRDDIWFAWLEAQRDEIERELGFRLRWEVPEGILEHRLAVRLEGADFRNRSDWPRQHQWLQQTLESLHRVFSPRVSALPSVEVPVTGEGGAAHDTGSGG